MTAAIATLVLMTMNPSASHKSAQPLASEKPSQTATDQSDAETIRQRVKEGQKVRVTDEQGREWQGRISALAPDKLVLFTREHEQRDLPYATIVRIDRPRDGLGNGALIGLGTGAALGLLSIIAEESTCEPAEFFGCGFSDGQFYVAALAFGGGVGAAIGVGIDALIKKDPNLFRRGGAPRVTVAPTIARERQGITVSLRW